MLGSQSGCASSVVNDDRDLYWSVIVILHIASIAKGKDLNAGEPFLVYRAAALIGEVAFDGCRLVYRLQVVQTSFRHFARLAWWSEGRPIFVGFPTADFCLTSGWPAITDVDAIKVVVREPNDVIL